MKNSILVRAVSILLVLSVFSLNCFAEDSETPVQAIQSIIKLYEAKDFESLVRKRYAEISKAKNEQQIQSLIDRFTTSYQDEKNLNKAISIYKSTLKITPAISEDGKVAKFNFENGFIKLSKMTNGKWGFHM